MPMTNNMDLPIIIATLAEIASEWQKPKFNSALYAVQCIMSIIVFSS